jgi:hypothetical protein
MTSAVADGKKTALVIPCRTLTTISELRVDAKR